MQVYTVTVKHTTAERKTAEKLLAQMLEVLELLTTEWGVEVIAFTTDALGEYHKAH